MVEAGCLGLGSEPSICRWGLPLCAAWGARGAPCRRPGRARCCGEGEGGLAAAPLRWEAPQAGGGRRVPAACQAGPYATSAWSAAPGGNQRRCSAGPPRPPEARCRALLALFLDCKLRGKVGPNKGF